ncbi:MAG: tRNA pseudouridine(55) synthase TruB [Clostridia bacterium]|nr:tRNA pseudouridine(55) synthase TruB [Clostridia bacterium]
MKNGFLVIDKPQQYTSFDVVAVLRKLLSERHIGHTGTLDPMATGVLVILLGRDTKAIPYLEDAPKRYRAGFTLGMESDTQDSTGTILRKSEIRIARDEVEAALEQFRGEISQIPPMYSAVSVGGKRLYDLARRGITVERRPRKVTIHSLELVSFDENKQCGELLVSCSKGTYIRTLCADLGQSLGVGALMNALRREEASFCTLSESITLDQARSLAQEGRLEQCLLPVEKLFRLVYPAAFLAEKDTSRFQNGTQIELSRVRFEFPEKQDRIVRVYDETDTFLGLGRRDETQNLLAVEKLFPNC